MAQMVEVLSVFAADRRLAEPRVVPRPGDVVSVEERQQINAASHGGLMNAALMAGKVVAS